MEAQKLSNLSYSDYINIEETTGFKHEYHNGTIVAMAGGTVEHGLISGNTFGELKLKLRGNIKNCRPINSEVKLHIEASNKFLYPDVMAGLSSSN